MRRIHVCSLIIYLVVIIFPMYTFASQFPTLTATELKASLESGGVVVYDIRTEGEYLNGHIPGAINILPQNMRSIALQRMGSAPGREGQGCAGYL